MYAYFKGCITDVDEDSLVIEVNNIGYRIYATKELLLQGVGTTLTVYTYTCVREDAFILYGFANKDDLDLFKLLITVSGVGPKMGLAILSGIDSMSIKTAIITQNSKLLSSVSGVGGKTANRIILELKDKIKPEDIINTSVGENVNSKVMELRQEAYEALVGLGITPAAATKALNETEITEDSKIEKIIKVLLTKI